MAKSAIGFVILISLVLPPVMALLVTGQDPMPYLNFPFITPAAQHPGFSSMLWWSMVLFVCIVAAPFVLHALRYPIKINPGPGARAFPVWGRIAVLLLIPCWVLAWTRFNWFAALQLYTFTPLWLCYLVIVNAISAWRKGHCLITDRPRYLLCLAVLSSAFWWYYEYLNGFIRNWHYTGLGRLSTPQYVVHASLAYATVLPAVISTVELLNTIPRLAQPFTAYRCCRLLQSRSWWIGLWTGGCLMLGLAATLPEQLFMWVWIAPLFIITGARRALGQTTLFSLLALRDWRPVILPAIAALTCGLFWELWNAGSLARWEYNIPYVDALHLFEMPALGYAGYLPFGMVCLAVAELLPDTNQLFRQD